jgi:hypothetical protein
LNSAADRHNINVEGPDIQMKLSFVFALLMAAGFAAWAQPAMPRMISVEPQNGKVGDVIAVSGENLAKGSVAKVYLTDDKTDLECSIVDQTDTAIKFKIPAKAAGRLSLMVLTTGKDAKLIEQPVKVQIDQ